MASKQPRPSIKGSALQAVIDDLKRLRDAGRVPVAKIAAEDRALLDEAISPALWYPIESYGRLTALLLELDGGGRLDYLRARGAKTAARLIESGIYQQLERATGEGVLDPSKLTPAEQRREFGRVIRLVTSLSGSIFNFGRWSVGDDPDHSDRFRITIEDARAMPEVAIHTIEGFINCIGEHSPHIVHLHWTGRRDTADTIVYVMDASVDAVYGRPGR